ncbi:MAG: hypothetical protein RMJ33_01715 [Saprospiraceae bacterium]|nr:hypothetical protein [Saprospiraceae bacterium]MDW8228529.1 hypothetical protein [Saprospiraceae bacterium]
MNIPASDASAPELIWMITRATGGGTPTSSIAPYSGESISITVSKTETVKVFLMARDEQSGVKRVKSTGGFGQKCSSSGTAIFYDGILSEYSQNLTFIRKCGVIEWMLPEYTVDTQRGCPVGLNMTELVYAFRGVAENNKGISDTSNLLISVRP